MRPDNHILIVEDEAAIADTLRYALETDGFSSQWVTTGQEALTALSAAQSLILLDVGLPDINGFDLLREIRAQSTIPVIFLTARSDEIDRVVGLELGADDYVTKPFSPREVVARVKSVLRRSAASAQAVSTAADIDVDHERALVRYHGQALTLTRAEFLLLAALAENPGIVLSRAQLLDKIWDTPHPSDERAIDTHIKAIRAKLRIIDDTPVIKTHRGLGYSFVVFTKTISHTT